MSTSLISQEGTGASELWNAAGKGDSRTFDTTSRPLSSRLSSTNNRGQSTWVVPNKDESLPPEFKVLERAFELKILASQYAIHLTDERRKKLFNEIDRLINPASWYDDDILLTNGSLRAFLRWTLYSNWLPWTALGVSHSGNLLVSWRRGDDRVTAEVFPEDSIRWTAAVFQEGDQETAVGICVLKRFPAAIQSHLTKAWMQWR